MGKDIVPFWEKAYQEYDTVAFSIESNATVAEFEHLINNQYSVAEIAGAVFTVISAILYQPKVLDIGCGEG